MLIFATVDSHLGGLHNEIQTTQGVVHQVRLDDRQTRIKHWLSPAETSNNHNNALKQRFDGTGQWFVKSEVFTSFKEGNMPFLWLNGIPGCGKTVLSSSIIEDLKQTSSDATPTTLYFYFDFSDSRKQTLEDALRSLLWQAAIHPGSISKELEQLYSLCRERKDQPSMQSLTESLEKTLGALDRTTIVIDALDECTSRPDLLAWLAQSAKQETKNTQTVVTSRREHDIETEFEKWLPEKATVPLRPLDVDVDISAYVHDRLRTDSQLERWQKSPEIQDEIEEKLIGKANGM